MNLRCKLFKKRLSNFCPTCRSTFRGAGTWHNCPETWLGCRLRSAAQCHQGLQRRLPSQWCPEIACSYHGWSRFHEPWPMGSCRMLNNIFSFQSGQAFLELVHTVMCGSVPHSHWVFTLSEVHCHTLPYLQNARVLLRSVIAPDQANIWADIIGRF